MTHAVATDDLTLWFNDRHRGAAANTRARGAKTLRKFVGYCVSRGWMEKGMLLALPSPEAGQTRRDWLTPETVRALVMEVNRGTDPMFDEYWRFSFILDLDTGTRPA